MENAAIARAIRQVMAPVRVSVEGFMQHAGSLRQCLRHFPGEDSHLLGRLRPGRHLPWASAPWSGWPFDPSSSRRGATRCPFPCSRSLASPCRRWWLFVGINLQGVDGVWFKWVLDEKSSVRTAKLPKRKLERRPFPLCQEAKLKAKRRTRSPSSGFLAEAGQSVPKLWEGAFAGGRKGWGAV